MILNNPVTIIYKQGQFPPRSIRKIWIWILTLLWWYYDVTTNSPTWSWATLVVNPSRIVGLLRPFLFTEKTISLRSRPGLRPVMMKTGRGLETLASVIPEFTSITSSMKLCSKPPSKPGSHLQQSSIMLKVGECFIYNSVGRCIE